MHEGLGFAELTLDVGLILRISAIDEGRQAVSHQVHFVAEPFDQYPAIPLAFLDSLIHMLKLLVHTLESPVNRIKTPIDRFKPSIDRHKTRIKAPVQLLKAPVYLLKFPV